MSILKIEDISTLEKNSAGYSGGAIGLVSPDNITIWRTAVLVSNVNVTQNEADYYGGGIFAYWNNLYVIDSRFQYNEVVQSGGGIYLVASGFGVKDSTLQFNKAIDYAAALIDDDDKDLTYDWDNDGGGIFSSFYDENYSNPPCIGFYSSFFYNNTAGNAGGGIWLGLYGDESAFGMSCVKFSGNSFGNHTKGHQNANRAPDGGRAVFLNVTDGEHPILFGDTTTTKLCYDEANVCKMFESTVYYMCVQVYEAAGGDCKDVDPDEDGDGWEGLITNVSLATDTSTAKILIAILEATNSSNSSNSSNIIEMFPGDSEMFQVFGWDVFGNLLTPNEWSISLVADTGQDVIDLTETIESPAGDSWLFPLFSQASAVDSTGQGFIYDDNAVAVDLAITVLIVNCSDGYEYYSYGIVAGSENEIFTCTACAVGTYIMNSNNCTACVLGIECMGTDQIIVDQYWFALPQADGQVATQLCPPNVCCGDSDGCDFWDKETLCSLNRDWTSPLCGKCVDGTTETSSASGACGVCSKYSALIFLLPGIAGFLFVGFYIRKGLKIQREDIPHPMVAYISRSALFVFQLLPFLTFQSSSELFSPLAQIANFEIDFSGGGGAGQCYLQDLGPRNKIGIGLVPSFIFMGQLGLLYVIVFFKSRKEKLKKRTMYNQAFYQAFWALAIMLYAKVTASLLKLVDCRDLCGEDTCDYGTVMWYAGSIECYDDYHIVAAVFLALAFLAPFFVVYILRRVYIQDKGWKLLRKKYPALVMPYRRGAYWYSAWNLARRFVIIGISSVPTSQPDYTATALAVVIAFVLGAHVFVRPFYHEINNKLETYCLFCAFGISILNIMLDKPDFFGTLTALLAFAPALPIPFLFYRFAVEKSPVTTQMLNKEGVTETDDRNTPQINAAPSAARTLRRRGDMADMMTTTGRGTTRIERAKTQRKQEKVKDESFFAVNLGQKKLHVIKKSVLLEEGPGGAPKAADLVYYDTDDSRSWDARDDSLTKDEDFVDEELDKRGFWQVMLNPHGHNYKPKSDDEESTSSDSELSSLADGEVDILGEHELFADDPDAEDDLADFRNDYWERQENGPTEKALFGGKVKLRRGLKEQRRIAKEQREMLKAAQKAQERRATQMDKRRGGGGGFDRRRKDTRDTNTQRGNLGNIFKGGDGAGDGDETTMAFSIELQTMRSMDELFEEDPFEVERRRAAEKKRKRDEAKRKKKEEERRKREEEEAKKSDQDKLDDLWGKTDSVASVDNLHDIDGAVQKKLSEIDEDELSSEDDGIPANELLDDDGAAVIQIALTTAMNAILDIACGEFDEDDDDLFDDEDESIISLSFEAHTLSIGDEVGADEEKEEEIEKQQIEHKNALPSGTLDTDTKNAYHLYLGSDFQNEDGHAALTKTVSPKTVDAIQLLQNYVNDDDEDDHLEDAMEMAMQISGEEDDDDDDKDVDVNDVKVAFDGDNQNKNDKKETKEEKEKETLAPHHQDEFTSQDTLGIDMDEMRELMDDIDIDIDVDE